MEILIYSNNCKTVSKLWPILIIFEIILAINILIYDYYGILFAFALLLFIVLFSSPELFYLFFLLNIVNHLFQLQIDHAFSIPPRIWRMENVSIDIVLVYGLVVDFIILWAALSWLFARMAGVRPSIPKTSLDLPMMVFFLWVLISFLWAPDWIPAVIQIIMFIGSYLAYYLSLAIIRNKKLFHITIWILLAAGVVNATIAIFSLHGETISKKLYIHENLSIFFTIMNSAKERGSGLTYTLFTMEFLNIVVMLGIGMLIVTKAFKIRILLGLILLGITFGSLTTVSKAGILSLVGGLVFFIMGYKPLRKYWYVLLPVASVLLFVLLQFLPLSYPWPERANLYRERLSLFPRGIIWENGLEDLIANYGLGYGVGSFYFSHNLCLDVLFNFGIIGLAIWLWLLYRLYDGLKSAIRKNSVDEYYETMLWAVSASLVTLFICSLSNGFYFEEKTWTFFGISMALINLVNATENNTVLPACSQYSGRAPFKSGFQ